MGHKILRGEQGGRLILKKTVAASAGPAACITRNHPDRTLMLRRQTRRDQGTAAFRTLHHHHRSGHADDQTVSGREMPRANALTRRPLTQQQTVTANLILKRLVMAGIDAIQRRAQDRHRRSTGAETTPMGGGINALRQATDDRPASASKGDSERFGHRQPMAGGSPGAHHGDGAALRQPREQVGAPALMQRNRWRAQPVQARGPTGIHRHQYIRWDGAIRIHTAALPVTIHLIQERTRPGQNLLQALPGPEPTGIQPNVVLQRCRLERGHPRRTDPRAAAPDPPPTPHPDTINTFVLA